MGIHNSDWRRRRWTRYGIVLGSPSPSFFAFDGLRRWFGSKVGIILFVDIKAIDEEYVR
jgi:hypothetical protein